MFSQERKKSRVDIVWMTMKEKVMQEIQDMLIEEGGCGEPTSEFIFKNRTTAAKRVFIGLSNEDQDNILKMIEEGGDIVPNDIKQK